MGCLDGPPVSLGLRKVILKINSKLMKLSLTNTTSTWDTNGVRVKKSKEIIQRDWQIKVIHNFREANIVVDGIVN